MRLIIGLIKVVLLLLGGTMLVGGGACAVIDLMALGSGDNGGYGDAILMALAIALVVAGIGWLMVRYANKLTTSPGKQAGPDQQGRTE